MSKQKVEIIQRAIDDIPITYQYPPKDSEAFVTLIDVINRLYNWSFFHSFVYVIELSKKDIKTIMRYIYYRKELWPSCQLNTSATSNLKRKQSNTKFSGKSCPYLV
jgi:hypothetical protein